MDDPWTGVTALVDPSRRARYEAPADQPRGRGRSPKVYEATGQDVTVSIPERRYQLVAEILAAAVDGDPHHADRAATEHARQRGRALGTALRTGPSGDPLPVLTQLGFEPRAAAGRVLLGNCPFHALATRYTGLVCGLNHAFLTGLLEGLHATGTRARLAPHPDRCCVELDGGAEP